MEIDPTYEAYGSGNQESTSITVRNTDTYYAILYGVPSSLDLLSNLSGFTHGTISKGTWVNGAESEGFTVPLRKASKTIHDQKW
jgi:hypothetical protein